MSTCKGFIVGCGISASCFWLLSPGLPEPGLAAAVAVPTGAMSDGGSALPDFTRLLERVGPSVVHVTTRSAVPGGPEVAQRHFDLYRGMTGEDGLETTGRAVTGLGSGFVLGDDGYILTNAHVVDGADEVYVRLMGSKRDIRAWVVGLDPATDIALLRVGMRGLRPAAFGSSAALRVGDWVAAIGSPFGFDHTITAGIVSAKERYLSSTAQTRFLQSDVAINPGSSGGPLVNLRGEVVGINSKIYTRTGGYMGVSFAIPIETALRVGHELRRQGQVTRGYLGVEMQPLDRPLAASFGLEAPRGVLVTAVAEDSPAQRAGIQSGDIILAFGGKRIEGPADLVQKVAQTPPGDDAQLEIWRQQRRLHADVVVETEPNSAPFQTYGRDEAQPAGGSGLLLQEHAAPGLVRTHGG
jgi:serine protease Do